MPSQAQLTLVGAGPGDPDLLTMKAMRAISNAEVVVFDRLVSPEIMDLVPKGAMRIGVGKAPKNHTMPQEEINELLVTLARTGRRIVRLKGGDPFIFGRGSEEAAYLTRNGIEYDVVPGITSAQGCAASTRIPLTHRGAATSVRYVTGHCKHDTELDLDWQGLADPDTTLVIYMGMANIEQITNRLMENGLAPSTPAAAINNGTTPQQRVLTATLSDIATKAHESAFSGPVLFILGEVVAVSKTLGVSTDAQVEKNDLAHLA
ncbi:MAG TPA: uroporphyrinogen-III C-methyltransferase [Rhizobiales bacterium]|nr:uroporphyrinogen-III C-methyltransferase [Hyphomicrobiales bacterium]